MLKKWILGALFALAMASAAYGQSSGAQQLTTLKGTEQVFPGYPCTVQCYFTTGTLAAFAGQFIVGVDAQTGTSYTVAASDAGKLLTLSNASAVAVTLPQAGTTGFVANTVFILQNIGAGAVTITPTTSTINGSSTLVLNQSRGAVVVSDGTNYQIETNASGLLVTPATTAEGGTGRSVPSGTPTIASGGCGATTNGAVVAGSTNQSGNITIGSATTTTCTVNFSATLAVAPLACVVFPTNAAGAATGTTVAYVSSITTAHFVITGTALANANYEYSCL